MAVVADVYSAKVVAQLNNGTDSSGNIKTVNVSMPSLNTSAYTSNLVSGRTALLAIVDAYEVIAEKTLYRVRETIVTDISQGA